MEPLQALQEASGEWMMDGLLAASQSWLDRKSTRLNSSHSQISYAVFCLKKKKNIRHLLSRARTKKTTHARDDWAARVGHKQRHRSYPHPKKACQRRPVTAATPPCPVSLR